MTKAEPPPLPESDLPRAEVANQRLANPRPPSERGSQPPDLASQVTVEQAFYSGPLPDPETLRAYGEISPDLVERIVTASEEERSHRHQMDRKHSSRASMGLAAGFLIAVLFLVVSAWLIGDGHEVAGAVIGSFDLVALTAVFVLGRRDGSK